MNNNPITTQGQAALGTHQAWGTQDSDEFMSASSSSDCSVSKALERLDSTSKTMNQLSESNHLSSSQLVEADTNVETYQDWLLLHNTDSTSLSIDDDHTTEVVENDVSTTPSSNLNVTPEIEEIDQEKDRPALLPSSALSSSSSENLLNPANEPLKKALSLDPRASQEDTQNKALTKKSSEVMYEQLQGLWRTASSKDVTTQLLFWSAVGVAFLGNIYTGQQQAGRRSNNSPPGTLFQL